METLSYSLQDREPEFPSPSGSGSAGSSAAGTGLGFHTASKHSDPFPAQQPHHCRVCWLRTPWRKPASTLISSSSKVSLIGNYSPAALGRDAVPRQGSGRIPAPD